MAHRYVRTTVVSHDAVGSCRDGAELTDTPYRLIQRDLYNHVPVIVGTNQNEADLFVPSMYTLGLDIHFPLEWSDLPVILNHFFNDTETRLILHHYVVNCTCAFQCIGSILKDYLFVCPARRLSVAMAHTGVWSYQFDYRGDWIDNRVLGDYHSSELEFVFDNAWPPFIHTFSKRDQHMADVIGMLWANMIHTATSPGVPWWPPLNATYQYSLVLNESLYMGAQFLTHHCALWDE